MPSTRTWSVVLLLACAGLFLACDQPAKPKQPPSPMATPGPVKPAPEAPRPLMLSALESLCQVDLDGASRIFAEDAICELASSQAVPYRQREGQKALWSKLQLAFPDVHIQAKQVLESPGFWVLEAVISGTHQGRFMGEKPTQRLVGCQIAVFCWVENEKIKRAFVVGNPDTILKQMTLPPDKAPPIPEIPEHPRLHRSPGAPENARAVKDFFQAFEKADWKRLEELVSPKIVVWSFGDGQQYAGLNRLKAILRKEQEALEGHVDVLKTMAAGPYVAVQVGVKGKLLKDLGPLKAGGSFAEKGVDVFRFADGKIVEWRNYRNQADLIAQLRAPAPAPAE